MNGNDMNVLQIAAVAQANFSRMEMEEFGYETKTTFWGDLTIAEAFGEKAIRNTFDSVRKNYGNKTEWYTEFVLCLNHKCWAWYNKNNELSQLYSELYYDAHDWVHDNWNEEQLSYYFRITD